MARTTPESPATPERRPADGRRSPEDAGAPPLYWKVATRLLAELWDGAVPPGGRLPGERRLAGRFGVSRETVRQALDVLRRQGHVSTDRRGSHATLPGLPVQAPAALTFPVGALSAERTAGDRTTVAWETPSPEHAAALGLAPHRPALVHRYEYAAADGSGHRRAVTTFSAVALAEVAELGRYADRADGTGSAQLGRAYDWMRKAGLTLHHRDAIIPLADAASVRVVRRVHDQYARPLEITDLLMDDRREALVYEFTMPSAD